MKEHANINYRYISVVFGNPKKLRDVITAESLTIEDSSKEGYSSWCKFTDDYLEYSKNHNKHVKGYDEKCYSDWLPIDIDNSDLKDSLTKCREVIDSLINDYKVPVKSLKIYFSGSKGFHIEVLTILFGDIKPSSNFPYIVKDVFKNMGLGNIDQKIYNRNALWRIPNTINKKSNLYKVPITVDELRNLSIFEIKELASGTRKIDVEILPTEWDSIDKLKDIWNSSTLDIKEKYRSNINNSTPQITTCVKKKYPGVEKGKRNKTAFQIARGLKASGNSIIEAKDYIINKWNPKNNPPENNILSLKHTIESAYSYNHYDSGSIGITQHFRTDRYYKVLNNAQKVVYVYLISHINEVEKIAWEKFKCGPNQIITSPGCLSEKTNVTIKKVKTLLTKLKDWGRISIEVLKEGNKDICSRITFHCIDLEQPNVHQKSTINDKKGPTDGTLLTYNNGEKVFKSINVNTQVINELNISIQNIAEQYAKLEKKLSKLDDNKKWLTGVKEISNYLGDGYTKVSGLIKTGQLKSYRTGKKIKVSISDADSFIMFEKPFNKLTRPQKAAVNCNE